MNDCVTPACPFHLQFPEMIEEVQHVRAGILFNGKIAVVTQRTAKLRCADCGAIEIVKEPVQQFILDEFGVDPAGLALIIKRRGLAPAGFIEAAAK